LFVTGVSALSLAAATRADIVLSNGGFETGELDPWSAEGSFDPDGAEILSPGRLDAFALHLDALEYDDQYTITQLISPTAVSDIVTASLWSMCPTPRWGTAPALRFHYEDGTSSEQAFGLESEWTYSDALGALTPGQVLVSVEVRWYGLGDEGPGTELFLDDITIETVPAPGMAGGLVLGLVGVVGRRRRA
jgi:hypothetical protein